MKLTQPLLQAPL